MHIMLLELVLALDRRVSAE